MLLQLSEPRVPHPVSEDFTDPQSHTHHFQSPTFWKPETFRTLLGNKTWPKLICRYVSSYLWIFLHFIAKRICVLPCKVLLCPLGVWADKTHIIQYYLSNSEKDQNPEAHLSFRLRDGGPAMLTTRVWWGWKEVPCVKHLAHLCLSGALPSPTWTISFRGSKIRESPGERKGK